MFDFNNIWHPFSYKFVFLKLKYFVIVKFYVLFLKINVCFILVGREAYLASPPSAAKSGSKAAATSATSPYKVVGTSAIDVAAHMKLLGESLYNIGYKLKEHEVRCHLQFAKIFQVNLSEFSLFQLQTIVSDF